MPGSPEPFKLGYRPALDGLRAVAVLTVLAYHAGLIEGGFLGVDVFFTLSGFLITTLLLEEHTRTGAIAIARFYARRALRLLPALVALLLVCGGVLFATLPPEFRMILGGYLLGVLGYVANWLIIYWQPLGVFGHTWSLAIEEQFYLVWPVLLLLLLRWVRCRWIVTGLVTAAAGSLLWRLALGWGGHTPFFRLYAGTDTHADGLLIGAALAVWLHLRGSAGPPGRVGRVGGAVAALGLLGLLVTAPLVPGYGWGVTALAALATGGVICGIIDGRSWVTRCLEMLWLVGIGRISYGVYLWHFPVFFQVGILIGPRESAAPLWQIALAWSLTFAAALISYFLIERPCLVYKARLRAYPEVEPASAAVVSPATKSGGLALPANR
jgi:peptidoglycan/LPS O-acetylase OafA/YrhL